jgi:hypothetical protein
VAEQRSPTSSISSSLAVAVEAVKRPVVAERVGTAQEPSQCLPAQTTPCLSVVVAQQEPQDQRPAVTAITAFSRRSPQRVVVAVVLEPRPVRTAVLVAVAVEDQPQEPAPPARATTVAQAVQPRAETSHPVVAVVEPTPPVSQAQPASVATAEPV